MHVGLDEPGDYGRAGGVEDASRSLGLTGRLGSERYDSAPANENIALKYAVAVIAGDDGSASQQKVHPPPTTAFPVGAQLGRHRW